jgi:hypothetical protein
MANRDLTCDRLRKVETPPKETRKMNVGGAVTEQQASWPWQSGGTKAFAGSCTALHCVSSGRTCKDFPNP